MYAVSARSTTDENLKFTPNVQTISPEHRAKQEYDVCSEWVSKADSYGKDAKQHPPPLCAEDRVLH